jgi:hypothetical protein
MIRAIVVLWAWPPKIEVSPWGCKNDRANKLLCPLPGPPKSSTILWANKQKISAEAARPAENFGCEKSPKARKSLKQVLKQSRKPKAVTSLIQ